MHEVRPQLTYKELPDFASYGILTIKQIYACFQCRLAVELPLLLLKLPYKYHTFNITSTGSTAIEKFSAFKPAKSQHCAEMAQMPQPGKRPSPN